MSLELSHFQEAIDRSCAALMIFHTASLKRFTCSNRIILQNNKSIHDAEALYRILTRQPMPLKTGHRNYTSSISVASLSHSYSVIRVPSQTLQQATLLPTSPKTTPAQHPTIPTSTSF
jgi:hypothetical protein